MSLTISTTRAVERCERLAKLGPAPAWWRVFALRRWLAAYRAIMALDISAHAEVLRSVYPDEQLRELATAPNPFIKITKQPAGQYLRRKWVEPVVMAPPGPMRYHGDDMEVGKPHPVLPPGAIVKSIDRVTGEVTYEVP